MKYQKPSGSDLDSYPENQGCAPGVHVESKYFRVTDTSLDFGWLRLHVEVLCFQSMGGGQGRLPTTFDTLGGRSKPANEGRLKTGQRK